MTAAALRLEERGALYIDGAVGKLLPQFPRANETTFYSLLHHSAALRDYTSDPAFVEQMYTGKPILHAQLLQRVSRLPRNDVGRAYSNTGFILLGGALERAAKVPIAQLLRAEFLTPMGLESTYLEGDEPTRGRLARGFDAGEDMTDAWDMSWLWSAGAMAASLPDTAHWISALYRGQVLSAASTARLRDSRNTTYSLGTQVLSTSNSGHAFGHWGSVPGYRTGAFYIPSIDTTVVAVVTDANGSAECVVSRVASSLGVSIGDRCSGYSPPP
jgi:D-alanyl-D-alanine carboxypeptidase